MKSINENVFVLINDNNIIELNLYLKNSSHYKIDFEESFYEIAFTNKNIELLKLLLKNDSKEKDIISYFYSQDALNIKILKFILRNGYVVTSDIISELIMDKRNDLLIQIFDYLIFDNDFILKLLLYNKNEWKLSNKELNRLIIEEKYKIDVNRIDKDGNTPLVTACICKNEKMVKYLIEHGADVNKEIIDIYGYVKSPLTSADGNENIIKYLVENGADVNKEIVSKYGYSYLPLINACIDGNETIVKYLVQHNADVNKKNKRGNTPLGVACVYGHENIIKFLIDHGVDINQEVVDIDERIKTPLSIAYENGNETIIKYLKEHGAKMNRNTNINLFTKDSYSLYSLNYYTL